MKVEKKSKLSKSFIIILFLFEVAMFFAFGFWMDYDDSYDPSTEETDPRVENYFTFFSDSTVLTVFGFAFMLIYLRKYAFSSAGFSFLLASIAFQLAIVFYGFFYMIHEDGFSKFKLTIETLGHGIYGSLSVLITFGAVIGQTTPTQLIIIAIFEIFFFELNHYVCIFEVQAIDIGGAIYLHEFAGFFAYALSAGLGKVKEIKNNPDRKPSYNSNLFSILGTMFLWILWPSLNGIFAIPGQQFRAIINTILAMSSSVITSFAVSIGAHGKLDMFDIQNASLAGGIVVAGSANLSISPLGSLVCGIVGAFISTIGTVFLHKFFYKTFGYADTRASLFVHGFPGIVGGIASVIAVVDASSNEYPYYEHYHEFFPRGSVQFAIQIAAIGITILIAYISGWLVGKILNLGSFLTETLFDDGDKWHTPSDFKKTQIDPLGIPRDTDGNVVGEWIEEDFKQI
eukprot:Anaeramoba_ignava/c19094_g1_i1.p1 GENE.c19094_g1_i1~~c19094_g1_i1.p1  ORF type:complete len:468 (-),score=122.01 c19094_g1_i1:25-1392(-)